MGLIKTEKIKASLKKIEHEVHQWLDPAPSTPPPFQVSLDFESDRFQFESSDHDEFSILLFSRMANYFEKGLLLEADGKGDIQRWFCSLHFAEGHLHLLDPALLVVFPVPSPGPKQVFKSDLATWNISDAHWQQMIPRGPEWSSLAFEISPERRLVFFTRLAEPWLKLQTENAHRFIETAMTAYP
jgi:hypothetical protein